MPFTVLQCVNKDIINIALICECFKDVREKYVKQYYYNRHSMMKFIK